MMAEQLGLDGPLARRCGFLHDIGKAADHEMEGGHPAIGAELLKTVRRGTGSRPRRRRSSRRHPPRVHLHRAGGRRRCHLRLPPRCPPRDAGEVRPPAGRTRSDRQRLPRRQPGVRRPGRPRSAGDRRSQEVDDREAAKMARDIAQAIEQTMTYPGEVKVTVMREVLRRRRRKVAVTLRVTSARGQRVNGPRMFDRW